MYKINGIFHITFMGLWVLIIGSLYGADIDTSVSNHGKNTAGNVEELWVYTWVDFIDPEIFSDFEKEFHVKVHVDFFDDEEVMFSLIQSQPGLYDVIFPSDSLSDVMIKSHLLTKLEMHHIPNIRNLTEKFRILTVRKWDGYSIPLDWGITGIVYNSKYVEESVDSWSIFWNTKYKGRMALLNNGYDVMTVGQKRLGYSLNPTDPKDMDDALGILKEIKPLLRDEGFMPYDKIMENMKNEELWIAQCYNGDAAIVNEENNNVKFVIPKEGTGFWTDNIAIPVGSKNKRLAEVFINFMFRPDISARHTNFCYYANCNKKAGAFVRKEILDNSYIYIDKKVIDKFEFYEILDPNVQNKFNECWAELLK